LISLLKQPIRPKLHVMALELFAVIISMYAYIA